MILPGEKIMKIAPSVLAADFSNLECELKDIETGGADLVHLDVMDGTFVPNISFGPPVIQSLRKVTLLPFDVHLMTYHPEYYFDSLGKIGVDMISFHQEAVIHVDRTIHDIKSRGIKAGIALNPGTSLSALELILPLLDFVLIMSVNPGFGGQKFIEHTVDKVRELRELITVTGSEALIEVDGGVNLDTGSRLVDAGADALVAGNAVFSAPDPTEAIRALKNL